jgi:hypothetical protein
VTLEAMIHRAPAMQRLDQHRRVLHALAFDANELDDDVEPPC